VARPEDLAHGLAVPRHPAPIRGLYYKLVGKDMVDRITDDEDDRARQARTPADDAGARLRGEFIRQANLKGKDYRVDWVYLEAQRPGARRRSSAKDRSSPTTNGSSVFIRSF